MCIRDSNIGEAFPGDTDKTVFDISRYFRTHVVFQFCRTKGEIPDKASDNLCLLYTSGAAAAALGIHSVKVTGGEPLVRKECGEIIQKLKGLPGIERVTLTTNGIFLPEQLGALRAAGVDGINISLDTVDRKNYRHLTGMDGIDPVSYTHLEEKSVIIE